MQWFGKRYVEVLKWIFRNFEAQSNQQTHRGPLKLVQYIKFAHLIHCKTNDCKQVHWMCKHTVRSRHCMSRSSHVNTKVIPLGITVGQSNMASSWSARSSNMFPISSRMFPADFTALMPLRERRERTRFNMGVLWVRLECTHNNLQSFSFSMS